ncbi:hypothetical protein V2J09_005157 [Rumex salicifolius]
MKFLVSGFRMSSRRRPSDLIRVFSFYPTTSLTSPPWVTAAADDSLFRRISPAGNPKASIVPILDQWLQEGRTVHRHELQFSSSASNFSAVSEWGEKMYPDLSARDISNRLELISKVHGLDEAEKYFDSIPLSRGPQVYYSLLHAYARAKSLEKAEGLMLMLKKMGFARTSLPSNIMIKLMLS